MVKNKRGEIFLPVLMFLSVFCLLGLIFYAKNLPSNGGNGYLTVLIRKIRNFE